MITIRRQLKHAQNIVCNGGNRSRIGQHPQSQMKCKHIKVQQLKNNDFIKNQWRFIAAMVDQKPHLTDKEEKSMARICPVKPIAIKLIAIVLFLFYSCLFMSSTFDLNLMSIGNRWTCNCLNHFSVWTSPRIYQTERGDKSRGYFEMRHCPAYLKSHILTG